MLICIIINFAFIVPNVLELSFKAIRDDVNRLIEFKTYLAFIFQFYIEFWIVLWGLIEILHRMLISLLRAIVGCFFIWFGRVFDGFGAVIILFWVGWLMGGVIGYLLFCTFFIVIIEIIDLIYFICQNCSIF